MAGDPASHISRGSLQAIVEAGDAAATKVLNPIMQCLQVRPTPNTQGGPERFRVVFSDINNFIQSMLATSKNHIVHEGRLRKGVLVRIRNFVPNTVKGRRILVILDLEVLEEFGEHEKIGQPEQLEVLKTEEGAVVKTEEGAAQQAPQQPGNISSNGFYGNRPQQQPTPATTAASTRTTVASASHANLYPIEALSPYAHKWTIKVRCTHKSDIKKWHNRNGEGKLFSVNFLDQSGEIRGTGFNEQCEQLYERFQEGQIYYISTPCRVQMAKKQFSNVNNDYELTFERDTLVEKAEDQEDVPQVRFNFTNIGDLQSVEKDTTIDAIGVLKEVGEVSQITSKTTSKPYDKRELTLVDNSGYSVRLTVWGNVATSFDVPEESVVAFKGVKVSDFGGRSLSLLSSGSMNVNPDIDDAHRLKGWYDAAGRNDSFNTHQGALSSTTGAGRKQEYKTIQQIKDENLGMGEEQDYFTLKATISYIRQDSMFYPACLGEKCNKKVVENDPGQWRCERCNETYPKPEYRYIMSVNVVDHSGQLFLNSFDETGRQIMNMSANELQDIVDHGDENQKTEAIQNACWQTYIFRCRAKMDNYQDQTRVRYQIISASPVNFVTEASRLTDLIKAYNIGSDNLFVS
ncbi:MAG: Replication factor A protein 1 [Bathelium mastoideum]|nr:MAG: Replication factor A protein 1 [Bathelium mastoideum]KAI9688847.1 MAG: Replication factor A protein 1 [Bathelium mastoideum]